jgi:hypothetical protein
MARLVPVENGSDLHLGYVKGWLEDDDPFFNVIERIIKKRSMRIPRILK